MTEAGEQEGHWSEQHDEIVSNADLAPFAKKFDSVGAMAKSGYELEQKLGSSFRLPDDLKTLTPEQQAVLEGRMSKFHGVPDSADGYEIEMKDGMSEAIVSAFKQFALENHISPQLAKKLVEFQVNAVLQGQEAQRQQEERDANKGKQDMQLLWGTGYEAKSEAVKQARMHISEELGLTYKDAKTGEICSKLDDALDKRGLGNEPAIMQMLAMVYEKLYAEAEPILGEGGEPIVKGESIYDMPK